MDNEMQKIARHLSTAPINLNAIFNDLGIDFDEVWMDEASGWIERNGDRFRIAVNANEPKKRRRFTAAHELAHYLLHRDLMAHGGRMHRHIDTLYDGSDDGSEPPFRREHEVQANRLAAQIVMPANLVRTTFAANADVDALARAFDVSTPAMEIRLKTLGLAA